MRTSCTHDLLLSTMLSDDPKNTGSRLSALLGSPVLQTPHQVSTTMNAAAPATSSTPPSPSRRSSARNSAAMGYPIYEPQSQRPYTPETEPELDEESEAQQFPDQPIPPALPTTPAPVHINPSSSTLPPTPEPPHQQPQDSVPSTSSPTLANTPTLNGTPYSPSPLYSSKPSFQSHRTLSSTTSFPPPDLKRSHTSPDPFSPFYLHPTTRTSLEVDRAGIKSLSPSASKSAIISIHPVSTTTNSASDLDASLSSLSPSPYPFYNSSSKYERTRRARESVVVVYPHGLAAGGDCGGNGKSNNNSSRTLGGRNWGRSGSMNHTSQSCELLRMECEKRRMGKWSQRRILRRRLNARQRLLVKLLAGFLIVGGVVGLVVGLWWRFARLQG